MNELAQIWLTAIAAMTAENLFLTQGMGFSRIIHSTRRGKSIGLYACAVTFFSLVVSLSVQGIWSFLPANVALWMPLIAAAVTCLWYLVACLILATGMKKLYQKISWCLAPAAINSVVLSLPFIARVKEWSAAQLTGASLGTGVAFLVTAWLIADAIPRLRHISMPASFRGAPALFLYVALLGWAFLGFVPKI